MITELRGLWKKAFGDTEDFMDAFFKIAYDKNRCRYIRKDGKVVCALYWFDVDCRCRKMAYLYGVATDPQYRGQGLASYLIEKTCKELTEKNYSGVILVPGEQWLFEFYKRLDFYPCTTVDRFSCAAQGHGLLRPVGREEYALLRRQLLPYRGVEQEGAFLELLESQYGLFAGEGFLLCAAVNGDQAYIPEYLGDKDKLPGVIAALGVRTANVCTPGDDRLFSMYRPLDETAPPPLYFGLAMD